MRACQREYSRRRSCGGRHIGEGGLGMASDRTLHTVAGRATALARSGSARLAAEGTRAAVSVQCLQKNEGARPSTNYKPQCVNSNAAVPARLGRLLRYTYIYSLQSTVYTLRLYVVSIDRTPHD
jgi:hypothetical protein